MHKKSVLILGSSGQDGPFLAQEFSSKGAAVYGVSRTFSDRFSILGLPQIQIDLASDSDFHEILSKINPDIVVNLASLSSVALCEREKKLSENLNFLLVAKIAKQIEFFSEQFSKEVHFVQASSSEMFGIGHEFCNENTQMNPITTYGKHKLQAHNFLLSRKHNLVRYSSIILFNHESEFRPKHFVSSKATRAAAEVALHGSTNLEFGNLQSRRDWGFAGDYMKAVSNIALSGQNNSYVIASSALHSVEEMLRLAFEAVKIPNYEKYIKSNSMHMRLIETPPVRGDNSLYKSEFGWSPALNFGGLVQRMVNYHLNKIQETF